MKITGDQDFSFKAMDSTNTSYLYSGYINKPLLPDKVTGYYDFIGRPIVDTSGNIVGQNRRIRKKARPDINYTLTATGWAVSGIYETPHGISYNDTNFSSKAGKTGDYNFYMAFYGPGYYQSRAGELLTFGELSPGLVRPSKTQIDDLSSLEALKIFGLRLVPKINASKAPFYACKDLGSLQRVHEGTHDCPLLFQPAFKFEMLAADLTAGTYLGGIGGNPYNHNPLPSPYDRGVFVASSLYKSEYKKLQAGQGGCYYKDVNAISGSSGSSGTGGSAGSAGSAGNPDSRPEPAFDIRSATNTTGATPQGGAKSNKQLYLGSRSLDGNASVCSAGADGEDSSVAAYLEDGAGNSPPHSEPLNRDDVTSMPFEGIDLSYNSKSAYWHYVFKNNHFSLPFRNTSETLSMVETSIDVFENEDHWWEYRECPENVDFLNHAFGNNITACPMNYLDVPYYASIGKFGYFGTRFQDTWRFVDNEDVPSEWEDVDECDPSSLCGPADGFIYKSSDTDPFAPSSGVTFKIDLEWKNTQSGAQIFNSAFVLKSGDKIYFTQNADDSVDLYVDPFVGSNYDLGILKNFSVSGGPNYFDSYKLSKLVQQRHIDYPFVLKDPNKALKANEEYYSHGANYAAIPTDKDYNNLIKLSSIEKNNYGFSISDQVIFLRLNYDIIVTSPEYIALEATDSSFKVNFNSFVFNHLNYNSSALYFSDVPKGLSYSEKDSPLSIFSNGLGADFQNLVEKYGYIKVTRLVGSATDMLSDLNGGVIDTAWYNSLVNNKIARISSRYHVNIGKGKPVDLFPEGVITFSFERASDFATGDFMKYHSVPNSKHLQDPVTKLYQEIPSTDLRYFHTAFSTQSEADLFYKNKFLPKQSIFGALSNDPVEFNVTSQSRSFYLGYLNPRGCQKELPKGSSNLLKIINQPSVGIWTNYAPESYPDPLNNSASPPRTFYEQGGAMDRNFSCFSPLFLQQPINTITKSWLPATFRIFALDYHSIPEDKIIENSRQNGIGRPEIAYWLKKIKAIDSKGNNLYPLKYKWYRIANANIPEYLKTKKESLLQPSDPTGDWYCFEGDDSPECTVVTPKECLDLQGGAATFPTAIDNLSVFAGPNIAIADGFHYFCRVIGRFGWRDSELAKITCDPTIEMEFAYTNSAMTGPSTFSTPLGVSVSFTGNGFRKDPNAVFEDVEERIWNPGNDCESWRYIGPEGTGGKTRVWTPGSVRDPLGKTIRKSHWTAFGVLSKAITSNEDLCKKFYAKRALPYCDLLVDSQGQLTGTSYNGVALVSPDLIHRTAADTATLTFNSRSGLIASRMRHIGELYPAPSIYSSRSSLFPGNGLPSVQPAHFQFENYLGLIKKFSRLDVDGPSSVMGVPTIQAIGGGHLPDLIKEVQNRIFNGPGGPRVISGPECGYTQPSFGRFMHFYVETFSTFYSLCSTGPKPKKVKNLSHIAGGLRADHAGLQFNWLGRPKNARLKRESMPGPYGFQWKVERHNRDRSGNGMSLGFWSYFWEERIDNMYDAAAVVGALKRLNPSPGKTASADSVRVKRGEAFTSLDPDNIAMMSNGVKALAAVDAFRNVRFGLDLGPKLGCGGIRVKDEPYYKPTQEVYEYSKTSSSSLIELRDFGCNGVNESDCFLPCVSLKWPDGFSPKGKKMMGATLTTCADCDESLVTTSFPSSSNEKKIWRKKISACSDGHRDACNYITPTIHLGVDCWPAGTNPAGSSAVAAILGS